MLKQIETRAAVDVVRVARIFRVLSVETRVRMVALLRARPMCVGALARCLGITAAAVSQHLRILRDAGAVVPEKRGYYVHYRADPDVLADWGRELAAFFGDRRTPCPGDEAKPGEAGEAGGRPADGGEGIDGD